MNYFEKLQKKTFELEEKKKSLKLELNLVEEELLHCTNILYSKCIEGGGHYLHRERDYQLYGEVTLICVNCGYVK
tara:strand:+ start:320 stop:544 length:225 start_codon:yes stop_codon:yes gene_type:complete